MRLKQEPIEKNWDRIKYMVAEVVESFHCRPEDVYAACKYKEAFLFINEDGFVILQEKIHEFDKEKVLFVWIAQGFDKTIGLFEKYKDEIVEIANSIGAKRIEFSTIRPGFSRLVSKEYKVSKIIYELEI